LEETHIKSENTEKNPDTSNSQPTRAATNDRMSVHTINSLSEIDKVRWRALAPNHHLLKWATIYHPAKFYVPGYLTTDIERY